MKKLLIFMSIALLLITTALIVSLKNQGSLLPRFLQSNNNQYTNSNENSNTKNNTSNTSNTTNTDNSTNTDNATNNTPSNSNIKITEEEAKKIALEKVNGNIVSFEKDFNDNIPKYEIEIHQDIYEYEIDVNAETGDIIKYEESLIND